MTDKLPIITFFATSDGTDFTTEPYSEHKNGNSYLPDVWNALCPKLATPVGLVAQAVAPAGHLAVRVSSVKKLAQWLNMYLSVPLGTPPSPAQFRMQIVAHSADPGSLMLGQFWRQPEPDYGERPHWTFDSNPYAILDLHKFNGNIAEIMLAGCYVANEPGGPILGFALHRWLGAPTYGSTVDIDASQFDVDGWFCGKTLTF